MVDNVTCRNIKKEEKKVTADADRGSSDQMAPPDGGYDAAPPSYEADS